MSLADGFVEQINRLNYTESPNEIVAEWESPEGGEHVASDDLDENRWTMRRQHVYRCSDGSLFAVELDEPLTEMQEGCDPNAEAYLVEPYEVTVTQYRKVVAARE